MLTWAIERCCLCGKRGHLKFCAICGHEFCDECRKNYWWRGLEFVKGLVGRSNLYCGGVRHG